MTGQETARSGEQDAPCPVPECANGYVRVSLIVERTAYGHGEKFVRFEDFQCDECGGLGRVPTPSLPPGSSPAGEPS